MLYLFDGHNKFSHLTLLSYNIISYPYHCYHKKPCISHRNLPLKGLSGMGCRLYTTTGSERLFSRCRMWWYRYFRRYWLGSSSAYSIYCSDFGYANGQNYKNVWLKTA